MLFSKFKSMLKAKLSKNPTQTLESLAVKFADDGEIDAAKLCSEIVKERNDKCGKFGFTEEDFEK